jgi:hypothetical protein
MPFTWHREDSGYLAAAVAAVAVVAYFVFGNFGLLPTPFAAPAADAGVIAAVEPVLAVPQSDDFDVAPVDAPVVADRADAPRDEAPPQPVDDVAPALTVATQPGANFGIATPALVEGTVSDAASGVEDVVVEFLAANDITQTVTATVTCEGEARDKCDWAAEVPGAVGTYTVSVTATDQAGNETASEPFDITVVNTGGAVKQVTETVDRIPSALATVVDGVLGLLGS